MPISMGPNGHETWTGTNKRPVHGRSHVTRHGVRFTLRHGRPSDRNAKGETIDAESNPVMTFYASWQKPGKRRRSNKSFHSSRSAARFIKRMRAKGVKVRAGFDLCAGFFNIGL